MSSLFRCFRTVTHNTVQYVLATILNTLDHYLTRGNLNTILYIHTITFVKNPTTLKSKMYIVHCTVYIVHCTVYSVQCTVYTADIQCVEVSRKDSVVQEVFTIGQVLVCNG